MIIDKEGKQIQIEVRDINYILPQYIRSYLFYTKNEDPEKIVFPLFPSVPHPTKPGVSVPIEYVPLIDPAAIEIAQDGSNIPEVTPAQDAALDEKDEEIKRLKIEMAKMELNVKTQIGTDAKVSNEFRPPATKTKKLPDRAPRVAPGGDIGPGMEVSDSHPRGRTDLSRTKQDLADGPEINEAEEKPYEKTVKRDEKGNPVVEE